MPSAFDSSQFPGPGRRPGVFSNPRSLIPLAVMAAVVLVFVLIVRFVLVDDEEGPSGPKGDLLWWLDAKAAPLEPHQPTAWPSGDLLAVAAGRQVAGYGIADGKKRWAAPLPGDICATSREMADGRIAVLLGSGAAECDRVQVFDVRHGKAVWQRTLPRWDSSGDKETQVVIADGAVAVQRQSEGVTAFRLRDGKPAWRRAGLFKGCLYSGIGGGAALVAELECGGGTWQAVQLLGTGDGRPRWTHRLGEDIAMTGVFSTNPVVLGVGESFDVEQLLMLNKAGAPVRRMKVGDAGGVRCEIGEVTWCDGIVVDGTTAYLRAKKGDFDPSAIAAYDLTSGRRLWESDVSERAELVPVGVHDGRLIAAHPPIPGRKRGWSGQPSRVLAIDPRTGKATDLMWISESMSGIDEMIRSAARLYWADGRFVLLRHGPRPDSKPALAAFGVRPKQPQQ